MLNDIVYFIFDNHSYHILHDFFCNIEDTNTPSPRFNKTIWCRYYSVVTNLYYRCYSFFVATWRVPDLV